MRRIADYWSDRAPIYRRICPVVGRKDGHRRFAWYRSIHAGLCHGSSDGGMFELESSKIAVQKADGPVKEFASQMVSDHTKASTELATQAKTESLSVPTTLNNSNQSKIDKLQKLAGPYFSRQTIKSALTKTRFLFSSAMARVATTRS